VPTEGYELSNSNTASPPSSGFLSLGLLRTKSSITRSEVMRIRLEEPFLLDHPASARDLAKYSELVAARGVRFHPRFRYPSDGKVRPTLYGSTQLYDLGLCYETFYTTQPCRLGFACFWRHEPLTLEEKSWLRALGARNLEYMEACRVCPQRPERTFWYLTQSA
jgi:hypothetical protein